MSTFIYPSNSELTEIAAILLPRLTRDRPIFQQFPVETSDAWFLEWEQQDNYVGLQQIRGLDGSPRSVKRVGAKSYVMQPGVYGEFMSIKESEMATRRQFGTYNQPVNVTDLVMERQNQLLGREIDRMEQILWTLVVSGIFSVSDANGVVVQTDAYTTQTYTASPAWPTLTTSKPIYDFRQVQLKHRGQSAVFDGSSDAFMNRVTWNNFISNTNANDLGGRRLQGLQPVNFLADANKIMAGEDLPKLNIYDEGYQDDTNTFVPYIPDGKVVVFGKRPQLANLGRYRMVRNVNNPDLAPGPYSKTIDPPERVPRLIEVHRGHNGGPVLYYPSAIVLMNV